MTTSSRSRPCPLLALMLAAGCSFNGDPACQHAFHSPCPERFDVFAWCVDKYNPGCRLQDKTRWDGALHEGDTLTIPLSDFPGPLDAHDLRLESYADGTFYPGDQSVKASIDGVEGVEDESLSGVGWKIIRWDAFPADPKNLTIVVPHWSFQEVAIYFVDATCEAAHPPPDCPL